MRMTLKEVCNHVGVTRRAVQGYEKAGLVQTIERNKYGHLLYDESAIAKIQEIKQYQDFGFAVKEIKILLKAPKEDYLKMMEKRLEAMQMVLQQTKINIEKIKEILAEKREQREQLIG